MYKHILIPTDGSELSQKAIDHGTKLAKALNAKVTTVTVSAPYHIFSLVQKMIDTAEGYKQRIDEESAEYLKAAKDIAAAAGVSALRGIAPVIATVMMAGAVIFLSQAVSTRWNERMSRRWATSFSNVTSGVAPIGY